MSFFRLGLLCLHLLILGGCAVSGERGAGSAVRLTHGVDASAGGGPAYVIATPAATYYLEKEGGGLSSMVDPDGVDWLGFHNQPGSGWAGEYRGFPNAIHRQDGSFFHAMNAKTDPSRSVVDFVQADHVRITFTSNNGAWEGRWDFYPDRCDFTMARVSAGFHYWIQYEGVPGGAMDAGDYWYASADRLRHGIEEPFVGDLPGPEWMAFGDAASPRMLLMVHHGDDAAPDTYESRPDMTVMAFGRQGKNKFLDAVRTFSIGFVEAVDYSAVHAAARRLAEK